MVTPERFVPTAAEVVFAQDLGDFEFDSFLGHELGTELNGLRERRTASSQGIALLFRKLAFR